MEAHSNLDGLLTPCTTVSQVLDTAAEFIENAGYPRGMIAWDTPPGVVSTAPELRVWGGLDRAMVMGRMLQPTGFEPTRPIEFSARFRANGLVGIQELLDHQSELHRVSRRSIQRMLARAGLPDGIAFWVETDLEWGILGCVIGEHEDAFDQSDRDYLTDLVEPLRTAANRVASADSNSRCLDPLSPRELEVADLLAQARTNEEIASMLFVSVYTVKKHISRALDRTGLPNRTALALAAAARRSKPVSGEVFRDVPESTLRTFSGPYLGTPESPE
ncbi:MAG: helix-turn-helix transcriptional regulator [Microthrixaceae bacterium]|nr:helix-turn-helix transcriptional regulator [Microthrixaceae bacterium]MCB9386800.1 helix-turn-helix transcriptional regulator [Microthrixaceae bacterium]